jgi:hypothetical protein
VALNTAGSLVTLMGYRLQFYDRQKHPVDQSFESEDDCIATIRSEWPAFFASAYVAEDDHHEYMLVWEDADAAQEYRTPVVLVGRDTETDFFNRQKWQGEAGE